MEESFKCINIMEPRSPIFSRMKQREPEIYAKACEYYKIHEKLSETREALNFNLRCKINDLLPKSLRFVHLFELHQNGQLQKEWGSST